jgi:hypothetical protein
VPRPLGGCDATRYRPGMTLEENPSCDRHDSGVFMQLRTMHSDVSRPDVLVGLFECPECGHERWLPIKTSYEDSQAAVPAA